jgi:transposase InsO family protein
VLTGATIAERHRRTLGEDVAVRNAHAGPALQVEWAYRQVYLTNTERTAALAPWLEFYNTERRHSAIGGKPPISRLS